MALSWEEHIQRYKEQNEAGKVSIAEYAKANKLNPNTARRYLRNPSSDTGIPAKKTTNTRAKRPRNLTNSETGDGGKVGASDHLNSPSGQNQKVIIDHANDRNGKAGNENSVKHGLYMTPRSRDIKAAKEIMSQGGVPSEYLVERLVAHLQVLERAREESMDYLDNDYVPGEDGPVAAVKKLGMLLPAAPAIADLVRTIAQIQHDSMKGIREQQKHDDKRSEPEVIREAYRLQKEFQWVPSETAAYIEANGCKVPSFLLKLVDAELKTPPAIDDNSHKSIDDLDEAARAAREKRHANLDEALEVKRAAIADLVDRGGFGDSDSDGAMSGIELAEFDDDEEPDDALNHQLYGDDDE